MILEIFSSCGDSMILNSPAVHSVYLHSTLHVAFPKFFETCKIISYWWFFPCRGLSLVLCQRKFWENNQCFFLQNWRALAFFKVVKYASFIETWFLSLLSTLCSETIRMKKWFVFKVLWLYFAVCIYQALRMPPVVYPYIYTCFFPYKKKLGVSEKKYSMRTNSSCTQTLLVYWTDKSV